MLGPLLHHMEGLQRPHNRVLLKRWQQKQPFRPTTEIIAMRITRAATVVAGFLAGGSSALAQDRPPIIDMHMHARLGPSMSAGAPAPRPCMPAPCTGAPSASVSAGDPLRLTLEAMARHNIVLGYLSDPFENILHWSDEAPGRFLLGPIVFDPARADTARIRRELAAGRLAGIGEIAAQYAGIGPNDARLDPFFALAEEFDVPVLIHTEGIAGTSQRFRIQLGHPQLLEEVLARRPKIRLWLENAGFPFLEETISLMYRYPGVYADVSTITWIIPRPMFYRYLGALIDAGLGHRLMFGSDQMNWPETIDAAIAAIDEAPFLTAAQRRDIFYNNAARFLRLSEADMERHHQRR